MALKGDYAPTGATCRDTVNAINARRVAKQGGAKADYLKLDEMGMLGVTHMMMLDKKNLGDRRRDARLGQPERAAERLTFTTDELSIASEWRRRTGCIAFASTICHIAAALITSSAPTMAT
jgi:hypothetical protein